MRQPRGVELNIKIIKRKIITYLDFVRTIRVLCELSKNTFDFQLNK